MKRVSVVFVTIVVGVLTGRAVSAQTFPTDDSVLRAIWTLGMDSSQTRTLAQVLLDSIGPRLTGSPGHQSATQWLLQRYTSWGVPARREQYGTWDSWRRGITHIDLVSPRVRTLEGITLAWSPATTTPIEGDVLVLPIVRDASEFEAWLPEVRGKFVLISRAEPTCRANQEWEANARPESFERMKAERDSATSGYFRNIQRIGIRGGLGGLAQRIEAAGAAAIVTSNWSGGWGVNKIFSAATERVPTLDLSCEDYGLVYRLAENHQGPRLRLEAASEMLGEVPVYNVVAELRGHELPNEYVMLSAHLDSWDAASGATDNGTGTLTMLEAMRILKRTYPNPRRTIIVGHWGGEEQGLIGSRSFAEDHPEVLSGLQALFNQDNGTWRIEYIRMQGLTGAGAHFGRWFSFLPEELSEQVELDIPGDPERGGSDHMSFLCYGAPGFRLQSSYPEYRQYTWHTNRDTFDKIVFDDLRLNATLAASLAYLASEDPEKMSRDQRVLDSGAQGGSSEWPQCQRPRRSR